MPTSSVPPSESLSGTLLSMHGQPPVNSIYPPELDSLASLAADLARQLEPADAIFKRYRMDDAVADELMANPAFIEMVKQAHHAWKDVSNASERVRLKAVIALEEMLPKMYRRAVDPDTPVGAANDTFKTFKALAGMDAKEAADVGGRFSVTINLPGKAPATIEAAELPAIEVETE